MSTSLRLLLAIIAIGTSLGLVASAGGWSLDYLKENRIEVRAESRFNEDVDTVGSTVDVLGNVSGDVIASAGSFKQVGAVAGNVNVHAGWTELRGQIGGSVRAIGGSISLYGEVLGNVELTGGQLKMIEGSVIRGDLIVNGGTMTLYSGSRVEGNVHGHLVVATIESEILGDVDLTVFKLTVADGASIDGDLSYSSTRDAKIDRGANVTGNVKQLPPFDGLPGGKILYYSDWAVLRFLAMLAIGVALIGFAPRRMSEISDIPRIAPLSTCLNGVGVCFLSPIFLATLSIFVITLPIVAIAALVYILAIYGSMALLGLSIGRILLRRPTTDGQRASNMLAMCVGVSLLAAVRVLPLPHMNGIVATLTAVFGLGSLAGSIQHERWPILNTRHRIQSSASGIMIGILAVALALAAIVAAVVGVVATMATASRSAAFAWQVTPTQLGLAAWILGSMALTTTTFAIVVLKRSGAKPNFD